ncbi:hypothetical protein CR513_61127, partial [Mucuna pruriens]
MTMSRRQGELALYGHELGVSQTPQMILDKENKVMVVHYKSVDLMKDGKFSNRTTINLVQLHLVCSKEKEVVVDDAYCLPLESGVPLSIDFIPCIEPLQQHCIECHPLKRQLEKLEKRFLKLRVPLMLVKKKDKSMRLSTRLNDLLDKTFCPYLDNFVVVLMNDTLEEHVEYLRVVLQVLMDK